jgi:hypothetical protein
MPAEGAGGGGGGGDRGLRAAFLAIEELRGDVLRLAARVVAVEDELMRRVPADEQAATMAALDERTPELYQQILAADVGATGRVMMGEPIDKYAVPPLPDGGPPCLVLLPICGARCCSLDVPLTTQDLDEGVVRWDHGNPFLLEQEDGRCAHLGPGATCSCYEHRPAPCREYDCRQDRRIWIDYAQRILVPLGERPRERTLTPEQRADQATTRQLSLMVEARSLRRPG